MGILRSIRNLFYAATHANQLTADNERLSADNLELSGKLWRTQNIQRENADLLEVVKQQRDSLSRAIKILMPKSISLETLKEVYRAVYQSPSEYEKAGKKLLGGCWHAHNYIQDDPIWKTIEAEVYRSALSSSNILPESHTPPDSLDYLQSRAILALNAKFDYACVSDRIPVGRIDYLQPTESIEYRDAGKFVADIMDGNQYGIPMSITVYSEPKTGLHIDTSWRNDLDPAPQGFQIEPYEDPAPAPEPTPEFEFELE